MSVINSTYNKEIIAARMLKHAARYWGHNDAELDNFDPLVRVLIESCALELYKINNEISTVQERMLEKLARLLTPEVYTAAKPSHAIIHACPMEAGFNISKRFQFFYHKKISTNQKGILDSNIDLFFSPAADYRLVNGSVKYYATNNQVTKITNQNKEYFLNTSSSFKLSSQTIWLGLELHSSQIDFNGLTFYFDIKNHPDKKFLFPLLKFSKWTINNIPVEIKQGLWDSKANEIFKSSFTGFDEFNINQTIETDINEFYKQQFITITGIDNPDFKPENYPLEFERVYTQSELSKLNEKLYWFKIQLLPEFDDAVLEELMVSINCFPVINRFMNEVNYRLQNNFNIIPLLTTDQFLSIESVRGSNDSNVSKNEYWQNPFESNNLESGNYDVRTGDIERFDERNAVEMMNYLLELLRDESRAFAALGQDFVSSLVKELNQNIGLLEQKIKQNINLINQSPTYLLVNPKTEGENIFTEFWTTNGEVANGIKSGTKLLPYQSSDLLPDSLIFMTNTFGGADKLKGKEILNAYKNTLLTRGRIVTVEDIKSFCFSYFNGKIETITVTRGVAISNLPNEGLINTIEIKIVPLDLYRDKNEWDDLLNDLQAKLIQSSAMDFHYRVQIDFKEN